jgi:prolyl-tRNA synthetase
MRWSSLSIPTLRDIPAQVGVVSHQLLLRAGYLRQVSPTSYARLSSRAITPRTRSIHTREMERIEAKRYTCPLCIQRTGR